MTHVRGRGIRWILALALGGATGCSEDTPSSCPCAEGEAGAGFETVAVGGAGSSADSASSGGKAEGGNATEGGCSCDASGTPAAGGGADAGGEPTGTGGRSQQAQGGAQQTGGSASGTGGSASGTGGSASSTGGAVGAGGSATETGGAPATGGNDPGPATCGPPAPFDVDTTYSNTLHVSETGDDGADGTEDAPLATLRAAADQATPGTRIVLHAGAYSGETYLENLQGTVQAPIAIVGDGSVVLDGGGDGNVLFMVDPRYVVLENLTLQNSSINGLHINDGDSYESPAADVVIRNLTIRGVGTGANNDCIKLSGADRVYVVGNDISECNAGSAIDMVGCHDAVITGNRFHDTADGVQTKGGSSGTLIYGNMFVDVGSRAINGGGSTDYEYFRPLDATSEAANISIIANVIVRPMTAVAFAGCDGCVFANNTIVDPQQRVARILQETVDSSRFVPCRNGRFLNNVVVFQSALIGSADGFANVGTDTAPETFTFGSNLWWAVDNADFQGPILADPIPPETGSVIGEDPGFFNSEADDYHITTTSPAYGAGRSTSNAPGDFDGNCWADPPAIGAFQP